MSATAAMMLREALLQRASVLGRGTTTLSAPEDCEDGSVRFVASFVDHEAVVRLADGPEGVHLTIEATFAAEKPAFEMDFQLGATDWMAQKVGGESKVIRELADWIADLKVLEK